MCVEGVWDPLFLNQSIQKWAAKPVQEEDKMAFWKRNKKKDVPLVAFDEDPAVEPAEVVEAEVVEEVKPVSRNSDRTAIIVVGSLALVLFATLVVVGLLFANSVSKAAALEPVAPVAIEPAAPTVVVAEAAKPAADAEVPVAPVAVEQPKTVAQAQTAPSLPVIMTISQMGGGAEIEGDWKNPNAAAVKMPLEDTRDWDGIHKKDGKPWFAIAISSDKGSVTCDGVEYKFDKGFVAVCLTTELESITVVTGWNPDNENWNVWAEKFVIPSDMDIDEAVKEILTEWQATQEKPVAFAVLSDGTVFKLQGK